ncbi:MAG: hypothetical protein GTO24_21690 [candidate division Zixibacteria bacterium]|nr:hypothetical protein [candidate division Zixibacteria bacterium]
MEILNSLKLKSPYMAVFYSFFPGVLVHGSGHFYAGKAGIGSALLGFEAAGALLLYFGSLSAFQGSSHQNDTDAMGYMGLVLFAGSWVYDLVDSPIVVVRQNKYLRQEKRAGIKLKMKDGDLRLVAVWRFQI